MSLIIFAFISPLQTVHKTKQQHFDLWTSGSPLPEPTCKQTIRPNSSGHNNCFPPGGVRALEKKTRPPRQHNHHRTRNELQPRRNVWIWIGSTQLLTGPAAYKRCQVGGGEEPSSQARQSVASRWSWSRGTSSYTSSSQVALQQDWRLSSASQSRATAAYENRGARWVSDWLFFCT